MNKPVAAIRNESVFTRVEYRQFRDCLAAYTRTKVKGKAYETVIYDRHDDILAIVHAASIDQNGRCYPAQYYVRRQLLMPSLRLAA